MFTITIKGLLAHKLRLLATALAVILGVAFMAGHARAHRHHQQDLRRPVRRRLRRHRRRRPRRRPRSTGRSSPASSARSIDAVAGQRRSRQVPGVAAAEGSVFGYAQLIDKDGKALGNPAKGAPTLGGNWTGDRRSTRSTCVAGHAPQAADEVVIDKKSADGRPPSRSATPRPCWSRDRRSGCTVVGIASFGAADSPGGASVVLFTTPVAQQLVAGTGQVRPASRSSPSRACRSSSWSSSLAAQVCPHGIEVLTGARVTKETQDQFAQGAVVLQHLPAGLRRRRAVRRRVHHLQHVLDHGRAAHQGDGLLRAIGASRRQVLARCCSRPLVVGLIASVLGLAAGVGVAIGLKALLSALGHRQPAGRRYRLRPARRSLIAAWSASAVTWSRRVSPARKAAKVPPVAAMQDVAVGSTGYGSKQRVVVGSAILALGVGRAVHRPVRHVGQPRPGGRRRRAAGVLRRRRCWPDRLAAAQPRARLRRCPGCGASPASWPARTPCATPSAPRPARPR